MKNHKKLAIILIVLTVFNICCTTQNGEQIDMNNLYPWCIVAFDSLERSPAERINMLKQLGFSKYAYDWRDKHLDDMESELTLAKENGIEIISVWLWLNAKRDSLGQLSPSNERIFKILKGLKLNTTLWVSFNNNFFKDLTQEQSIRKAAEMIKYIHDKANAIGCKIALYNHRGWFGDPNNEIEIINALPQCELSIVFNFHHARDYIDEFPQIVKKLKPYLSSVNLNGMRKEGPKIIPIGEGDYEKEMIQQLMDVGFNGPWGILGHVENKDVEKVLEQNIAGLKSIKLK